MAAKHITSTQNNLVKQILLLTEKARERKKQGLFVVEGHREVDRAIKAGYDAEVLVFMDGSKFVFEPSKTHVVIASQPVFEKITYRGAEAGVVGLFRQKQLSLDEVKLPENPLIIIAEGIEKPGNLGAILRTANAAQASLVIAANSQVDLYHPNIIRNSLGGFFGTPVVRATNEDAYLFLEKHKVQICTTHLDAAEVYTSVDFAKPTALVFGEEARGVTDFWVSNAHRKIIIPMGGLVDSLNVSVSVGVVVFEALRQRGG